MPAIYFLTDEADLTKPVNLQPHHFIDLTKVEPQQLKSHKFIGLLDALKELLRIFHPGRENEEWRKGKAFLRLLDKVHAAKKNRPKTTEDEFEALVKLCDDKEDPQREFLLNLSPHLLLQVACSVNKAELEGLKDDLQLCGEECKYLAAKDFTKRHKKAEKRSATFKKAWEVSKGIESMSDSRPPPAQPLTLKQLCEQIDSAHTSIDQSTSPPPAQPPTLKAPCEQIDSANTSIDRSTSPPPKRLRVEASSPQDNPSQSPQLSSDQPSRQPAWRNTQERNVMSKSNSCASPLSAASTPQHVSSSSTPACQAADFVDPIIQERTLFISKMIEKPMTKKPSRDQYVYKLIPLLLSCTQYYEDPTGGVIFYPKYIEIITRKEALFKDLQEICVSASVISPKGNGDFAVQLSFEVEGVLFTSKMEISREVYKWVTKNLDLQKFNGHCLR